MIGSHADTVPTLMPHNPLGSPGDNEEDMPLSAAPSRDKAPSDVNVAERQRSTRERLEATVSGLGELEYLRQRQEVLVRSALEFREGEEEERRKARVGLEEKLLEENILLLRKQLVGPHLSVCSVSLSTQQEQEVKRPSLSSARFFLLYISTIWFLSGD